MEDYPKEECAATFEGRDLDQALAADLQRHLATKTPKAPAFNLPSVFEMADMLRKDLAEARVMWLREATKDPKELAKR